MSRYPGLIGVVAAGLLLLPSHGGAQQPPGPAKVLHIGVGKEIGSLDLALSLREQAYPALDLAYETLVNCDRGQIHTQDYCRPGLAAHWQVSEDGLQWTFEIAPGHFFHDGQDVTAEAVVFTFERLRTIGRGPSSAISFIDALEAPDDKTVVFRLHHPSTLLLTWLASPLGYILNPKLAEHYQSDDNGSQWLGTHSAGSGPYFIRTYNQDGRVVLERNIHHKIPAGFDQVVIEVVKDEAVRSLKLKEGELDMALDFTPNLLEHLRSFDDLTVHTGPSLGISYLALNTESGLMSNPAVRKAVSHAIDYDLIVNEIFQGYASTMPGPIAEGMFGFDGDLQPPAYDPALAKDMLKAAGVKKGATVSLLYTGSTQRGEATAQTIQAMLAGIGLRVRLERLALSALIERAGRGDYDMAMAGWRAEAADPALTINFWFDPERIGPGGNLARYNNALVGELLNRSAQETDPAKRSKLLEDIVSIVREDVPYIYLSQDNVSAVTRCELTGYELNPNVPFRLYIDALQRKPQC